MHIFFIEKTIKCINYFFNIAFQLKAIVILKIITRYIFTLKRWKVEGELPPKPHRFILLCGPHTSNWDVLYGLGASSIKHLDNKMLVNKKMFKPLLGSILKKLGAIPVNKEENEGVVSKAIEMFKNNKEFVLTINPEGGKTKCTKFRTGFYHIAKQANVPIVMCYFDYKRKVVGIRNLFYLTDNMQNDFIKIWEYYKNIEGKFPKNGISGKLEFTMA